MQDEFAGQGGSYILNKDGTRTRVEEPTIAAVRCLHPDAQPPTPAVVDSVAAAPASAKTSKPTLPTI